MNASERLRYIGMGLTLIQIANRGESEVTDLNSVMGITEDGEIRARLKPDAIRLAKRIADVPGLMLLDLIVSAEGIKVRLFEKESGAHYLVRVESVG